MYFIRTEHFRGRWLTNFVSFLQSGWTSLHKAAEKGHTEVAKVLLEANADVKAVEKVRDVERGDVGGEQTQRGAQFQACNIISNGKACLSSL